MSKVIAFYGAPGSGKTTIALKTAMEMYHCTKDGNIIFLSPDLAVPSVGLLFPNYDPRDVYTIASVLDNTEMSPEILLRNAVTMVRLQSAARGRWQIFPLPQICRGAHTAHLFIR